MTFNYKAMASIGYNILSTYYYFQNVSYECALNTCELYNLVHSSTYQRFDTGNVSLVYRYFIVEFDNNLYLLLLICLSVVRHFHIIMFLLVLFSCLLCPSFFTDFTSFGRAMWTNFVFGFDHQFMVHIMNSVWCYENVCIFFFSFWVSIVLFGFVGYLKRRIYLQYIFAKPFQSRALCLCFSVILSLRRDFDTDWKTESNR